MLEGEVLLMFKRQIQEVGLIVNQLGSVAGEPKKKEALEIQSRVVLTGEAVDPTGIPQREEMVTSFQDMGQMANRIRGMRRYATALI